MKIYYASGKKAYVCDNPDCSNEGKEVYSLICRYIYDEWVDVCHECYEEEEAAKCL